jgi:DnaJ-class molecular chaperone
MIASVGDLVTCINCKGFGYINIVTETYYRSAGPVICYLCKGKGLVEIREKEKDKNAS